MKKCPTLVNHLQCVRHLKRCILLFWPLFTCALVCSSLAMSTAMSLNPDVDVLLKSETGLSQAMNPYEIQPSQWSTSHQRLPPISFNIIPAKYIPIGGRSHWLKTHKRTEDEPPPGFVGSRGRRDREKTQYYSYLNGRRFPADAYKTLTEVFPHLWPHIKDSTSAEPVTEEMIEARTAVADKKSDNIVYKDGFLGVRG